MASPNCQKLSAEFFITPESNQIVGAAIRLSSESSSRSWRWVVDERSLEQVYGLHRNIQLIPSCLAVATSVWSNEFGTGGGVFLVRHLSSVFSHYVSILSETEEPKMPYKKVTYALSPAALESPAEHGANLTLTAVTVEIRNRLTEVLRCIQFDSIEGVNLRAAVKDLLEICEDTNAICAGYLDFIKPVLDLYRLSPGFSHVEGARKTAFTHILNNRIISILKYNNFLEINQLK